MTNRFYEATLSEENRFNEVALTEEIPEDVLRDFESNIDENEFVKKEDISCDYRGYVYIDPVTQYLRDISLYPLLKDEEFNALIRKAQNGHEDAYNKIVLHNLRLVVSVVKRYLNVENSLSMMDLIMEGNFGLFKAIDHFDPDKGFKFSTYAYHWIRQCVTRAIYDHGAMIRIPAHAGEDLYKYRKCINSWQQETGSDNLPPKEYVMKQMPLLTNERYKALLHAYNTSIIDSLNCTASVTIDDSDELIDFVPDETIDISAHIENEELAQIIDEAIERFIAKNHHNPDRTRDILYRRFGLHEYEPHTLDMVGKCYGISRERVRQIEAHFMKYCRTGYTCAKLRKYWQQ